MCPTKFYGQERNNGMCLMGILIAIEPGNGQLQHLNQIHKTECFGVHIYWTSDEYPLEVAPIFFISGED